MGPVSRTGGTLAARPPVASSPSPRPGLASSLGPRLLVAFAAVAGVGVAGQLHLPRPATLCPLRALTGVPCAGCGTTTALARAARLDLLGAFAANPVTFVALVLLVLAPLGPAAVWGALGARRKLAVLLTAFLVAWLWQLSRFGWIG